MQFLQMNTFNQEADQNQLVLKSHPNSGVAPEEFHRRGLQKRLQGKLEDALGLVTEAIRRDPRNPIYYKDLGNIYKDGGEIRHAIQNIRRALKLNAAYVEAHYDLGSLYYQVGRPQQAMEQLRLAIQLKPDYAEAYNNLAMVLERIGSSAQAKACYKKALELKPDFAEALNNIGNCCKRSNDLKQARSYYQKALSINPRMVPALNNLGQLHQQMDEYEAAIDCFSKALALDPVSLDAHINLGNTYQLLERPRRAKKVYEKVLKLHPDHPVALFNLGVIANRMNAYDSAAAFYRRAFAAKPDYEKACAYLVNQLIQNCAWEEIAKLERKLDALTDAALQSGRKPEETPFLSIVRHADPQLNLKIARAWSREADQIQPNAIHSHRDNRPVGRHANKLRIGYLSPNFGNHPSADLILAILTNHDRQRFEINCYHYGVNDGSSQRRRIEGVCDRFIDLNQFKDHAAARKIGADRVDILVDLVGHTKGSRLGICAHRPAPIQIRYLGFAGSTGADFYDYLIGDEIVTPPNEGRYYSEKLILMPACYHVNGHKTDFPLAISTAATDECRKGDDFVYCCFNAGYKIDPDAFHCWVEILKEVPKSVLWLLEENDCTRSNLRQQAQQEGLQPNRICFLPKADKQEHLQRLGAADLALDTLRVSGAATTADALWAGVPVITVRGGHFASRMSDSLLIAADLPELVTVSQTEYISKAIDLAKNHARLAGLKDRVQRARESASIFNPREFVAHLENGYRKVWRLHRDAQVPQTIHVHRKAHVQKKP
jgi:protein O-GlcNAc transferase